jgi:uncharacterized protein
MNFEFDDAKSELCLLERGFDFAYAAHAFLDALRVVQMDARYDYGEPRFVLLGMVQERLLSPVYTPRGNAFRIISARKANARERKRYDSYQDQP